jgi:hypothetical protein
MAQLFPHSIQVGQYLTVQATSAPSEWGFCVASRLIANMHAHLIPSMASKMLYVSQNWKWYESQIDFNEAIGEEN